MRRDLLLDSVEQFGPESKRQRCPCALVLYSFIALVVLLTIYYRNSNAPMKSSSELLKKVGTRENGENITVIDTKAHNKVEHAELLSATIIIDKKNFTKLAATNNDTEETVSPSPLPSRPLSINSALAQVTSLVDENKAEVGWSNADIMNVFVLTTWRSGSSFFGEAISSHPQIFYHYEPLMFFDYKELESGPELESALSTLKNLSACHYEHLDVYMKKIKSAWNLLTLNSKISSQCKQLGENCFSPAFLGPACQFFPIKLFKIVRLRGRAAERLLAEFDNSRIIYLVRDPRGTFASRMNVKWCTGWNTSCGHIETLCDSLGKDLREIQEMQRKHPSKIQVIKYEDVVWNPLLNFKNILRHLGIRWHADVEEYLQTHTHNSTADPMSTVKISKLRADQWRSSLPSPIVHKLETECSEFMRKLGYYSFVSQTNFSLNSSSDSNRTVSNKTEKMILK